MVENTLIEDSRAWIIATAPEAAVADNLRCILEDDTTCFSDAVASTTHRNLRHQRGLAHIGSGA